MVTRTSTAPDDLSRRRSTKADSELLGLIVCVGLSDRLEAMQIRDTDGPDAAIKFVREACTLTNETYKPSVESAKAEIRRQFEQAYALVSAAKGRLSEEANHTEIVLLDMAEDVLGELEYINRVDPQDTPEQGGAA